MENIKYIFQLFVIFENNNFAYNSEICLISKKYQIFILLQ